MIKAMKHTGCIATVFAVAFLYLSGSTATAAPASDFPTLTTITVVPADDDEPMPTIHAVREVRLGYERPIMRSATSLRRERLAPNAQDVKNQPRFAWPYTARTYERR